MIIFKRELTGGVTNHQKIFSIFKRLTQRCSQGGRDEVERCSQSNFGEAGCHSAC